MQFIVLAELLLEATLDKIAPLEPSQRLEVEVAADGKMIQVEVEDPVAAVVLTADPETKEQVPDSKDLVEVASVTDFRVVRDLTEVLGVLAVVVVQAVADLPQLDNHCIMKLLAAKVAAVV